MARTFDETDDRLTAADDAAYSLPGSGWTISVWVRLDNNAGGDYKYFLSWGDYDVTNSINLYIDEDGNAGNPGRVTLRARSANGTDMTVSGTAQPFQNPQGNWRHLAFRYTGSQTEIWIDGSLSDSTTGLSGADAINRSDTLYIGARSDLNVDRFFGGDLAEPAIWGTSLSSSEISELASKTPGDISTTPDSWWRVLGDAAPEPNEISGVPDASVSGTTKAASHPVSTSTNDGYDIPAEGDWTSQGTVLSPGSAGSWDERFPHGTPGTIVELSGTLYLYYIGADGDRGDGGPAHRKIGLATSDDGGSTWTKHASNPLLSHSPNGDNEEGFWRLAAVKDTDDTILLYATALTGSGGIVNGDIKLFTSSDGVNFTDQGIVYDHSNGEPGDDEKGVLGAFVDPSNGDRHLYYTAKGSSTDWDLYHALDTGSGFGSATLLDGSGEQWSTGSNALDLTGGEYLLPFVQVDDTPVMRRTSDVTAVGSIEETYTGTLAVDNIAIYLDESGSTWNLYATQGTAGDATSVDHWTAPLTGGGAISLSPGVASGSFTALSPSLSFGVLTLSPSVASGAFTALTPALSFGTATLSPPVASALLSALDPTLNISGAIVLTPGVASGSFAALDAGLSFGVATLSPGVASGTFTALGPSLSVGAIVLSPSPAAATFSALDAALGFGAATLSPSPASGSFTALTPTLQASGAATLSPEAAQAAFQALGPSLQFGTLTLQPSEATAAFTALAPGLNVSGSILLTPGAASAAFSALDPSLDMSGAAVLTPGVASAQFAGLDPALSFGALVLSPSGAVASFTSIDAALSFGSVTLTPGAAQAAFTALTPTLQAVGAATLSPSPAEASFAALSPSLSFGALALSPSAAEAVFSALDPSLTILIGTVPTAGDRGRTVLVTVDRGGTVVDVVDLGRTDL